MEHDDVDTEELIIREVWSIEPGTPVIEHQDLCWSEEYKLNILFCILLCAFKEIVSFALVPLIFLSYTLTWFL